MPRPTKDQDSGPPELVAGSGARSSLMLLNAGFRAIADIGSKIATAALYLLLARKTGAGEFGIFTFALSFAGIAVTLGQFGQEVVLIREVARDRSRLDTYYSDVLFSKIVLSVPPLLAALGIAALSGMSGHRLVVILLMGLGFIADFLIGVSFAVFQAYERMGLVPIVLVSQRWLTTIVAGTALFMGQGIVAVAAIYCGGALLASAFAAWLLFRRVGRPLLRFDLKGALRVAREGSSVGIGLIAVILLARIDASMLAIFSSSREVGQYGAAYRLLETTAFVTWAVNTAVLPTMSRLSPSTTPPVGLVFERALKLLLALTIPFAVGAAILATPLISLLYGSEYHRAGEALLLLSPTILLFPISSLASQLFYSQDVRKVVARTYSLILVENVVWNLVMIPRFGLYGAAAGTAVSELLVAGTLLLRSGTLHGPLSARRVLAGPLLASSASAAAMAALAPSLALAIPIGILAYSAVILAFERLAFPEDFALIGHFAARLRGGSRARTAGVAP